MTDNQAQNPFQTYADYYDVFYQKKSYAVESDYVLSIAAAHGRTPVRRVLDFGCGTGGHVFALWNRGCQVTGVDLSGKMIEHARQRAAAIGAEKGVALAQGDIRTYRDGKSYDLCIAMFAVIGYLRTDEDVVKAFRSARAHLEPGSPFIFDIWFGPAVISTSPENRIQEYVQGSRRIMRLVRSEHVFLEQLVRVNYDVLDFEGNSLINSLKETHEMRYFFPNELHHLLQEGGFALKDMHPFLDQGRPPAITDWNVTLVAEAK